MYLLIHMSRNCHFSAFLDVAEFVCFADSALHQLLRTEHVIQIYLFFVEISAQCNVTAQLLAII